jgi:hypothetical protein
MIPIYEEFACVFWNCFNSSHKHVTYTTPEKFCKVHNTVNIIVRVEVSCWWRIKPIFWFMTSCQPKRPQLELTWFCLIFTRDFIIHTDKAALQETLQVDGLFLQKLCCHINNILQQFILIYNTQVSQVSLWFFRNLKHVYSKTGKNIGQSGVHFFLHLHSIYFTPISIEVFRRGVTMCALSTSCEGLWCVSKPGPSPYNSPLDAWCCLACHHNLYVHGGVAHYQI